MRITHEIGMKVIGSDQTIILRLEPKLNTLILWLGWTEPNFSYYLPPKKDN